MVRVPTFRRAGVAFACLIATTFFIACGNDSPPPPTSTAVSVGPTTVTVAATLEAGVPDVKLQTSQATTYYQVSGTTTEDIFASIEANGPRDDIGQQGSGLTSVDWEYKWIPGRGAIRRMQHSGR